MTTSTNFCYRHPDRETGLRCNRCERPICASCAVRTPTGYRCPECIREQKRVFDTAKAQDYVLAFIVAAVIAYVGGLVLSNLGFFVFFLSPFAGIAAAEAVRWVVQKRRAKTLFQIATAGVVVGGLVLILDDLFFLLVFRDLGFLVGLLWPAIYIVIAAITTYTRLAGIQLRY